MADLKDDTCGAMEPNFGEGAESEFNAALLFGAHHVAAKCAEKAAAQSSAANQGLQQYRSQIEICADQARRLEVRLSDTRSSVQQLADTLDRIKLVALNTGLEGARLGESTGKALVAVADEVRSLASRGLDVVASHHRLMEEVELEQQNLVHNAGIVQTQATDLAHLLRQTHECQCDTLAALGVLEKNIERATGLDASAAADLQRVTEHGQGLLSALEGLSIARRHKVVKSLLLPTLEPLLRTLLTQAQLDSIGEHKP